MKIKRILCIWCEREDSYLFWPPPVWFGKSFWFSVKFLNFWKIAGGGVVQFLNFWEKMRFFGCSFVLSKLFTIFVMRLGNNYRGRSLTWLSQTNLFTNLLKIFNYDYDFIDGRKRPNFWGFRVYLLRYCKTDWHVYNGQKRPNKTFHENTGEATRTY